MWLLTRAVVMVHVLRESRGGERRLLEDIDFFHDVARHVLEHGALPATEMWQYPPGAIVVILVPLLAGAAYAHVFMAAMLACDALVTWMLLRLAREQRCWWGVWAWVVAMPFMRKVPPLRFDLVSTALAVAALVHLSRRPAWLGAVAGLGALVKAWPIVLVLTQPTLRRAAVAAAAASVVVLAGYGAATALLGSQADALRNQGERGLQEEAVAATPWHVQARLEGRRAPQHYAFGTLQIDDPQARELARDLRWATLAAALLAAAWWLARAWLLQRSPQRHAHLDTRAASVDFVAIALLWQIVVSKVLSPQFLLWMLALAGIALAFRETRMRRPLVLVVLASMLTFGILRWPELLIARNVLLVVAALDGSVILARMLRPGAAPARAQSA